MVDSKIQQLNFDRKMMRKCIRLAKKGEGFVSPNPLVGAIIVKNEIIISQGWHKNFGEAHAEINAINNASECLEGSTIYVNLEPCSHQGKTPACSLALIHNKFARVVIANIDPNPLVAGKGIEMLKNAGIEVESGILKKEAAKLNERFFKFISTKRPFLALKMASSLDGKIATSSGDSKWITNAKSRAFGHQLRQQYSAILVGINTVLTDDPALNVRLKKSKISNPLRLILDSKLQIPLEAKILDTSIAPTWIFTTAQASKEKIKHLESLGITVHTCPEKDAKVDLNYLVQFLGENNIDSVLVEGGGTVNFGFAKEKLVDKVYAFIAPKLIGGVNSKTGMEGDGFATLREVIELKNLCSTKIKNDLLIEAYT